MVDSRKTYTTLATLFIIAITLTGCSSRAKIVADINYVLKETDKEWAVENEKYRQTDGIRQLRFGKSECFAAAEATLTSMGFTVRKKDYDAGFLRGNAAAPFPFTQEEWERVKDVELERMHEIARATKPDTVQYLQMPTKRIGSQLIVTVTGDDETCTVSLTPGIRDHNDIKGFYAMQNPPPTAAVIVVVKFWSMFGYQLKSRAI